MNLIDEVKKYLEAGYSVIPINPYSKKPFFPWEEFQKRTPTEKEVVYWWREFPTAMIGIITGNLTKLFVLDIDKNHDNSVYEYIPETIVTPTARTPRDGIHLYFSAPEDPNITVKSGLFLNVDYRCNGGYIVAPPSKNAYGIYYRWLDGLDIFSIQPAEIPEKLLFHIYNSNNNKKNYYIISNRTKEIFADSNSAAPFTEGNRNQTLFHIAYSLVRGKASEDIIHQTVEILAKNCIPPLENDEISTIVQSAFKRGKGKERNITEEIRNWVEVTNGVFSVTNCYNELNLVTKDEKNLGKVTFHRLCKEGVIEKYGQRVGVYRKVEKSCEEIDILNVEEKVIDVSFPFEIEKLVKIMPKNIIVIAGESNAGKTAFLLSFCLQNFGKMPIHYFSSEMSAYELRERVQKFDVKLYLWKKYVKFKERSSNFADVIYPDEINIIDFMEMTDEFYRIAGNIREIYDRLNNGIAIIAIQKPKGRDLGIGGEKSLEKARLYLAIEHGKIKIVKAKNWMNADVNPNGLSIEFSLVQGAKFIAKSYWKH